MTSENKKQSNEVQDFTNQVDTICRKYLEMFPDEEKRLHQLLDITKNPQTDLRLRSTIPEGHVSASGIIVSHDLSKILMGLHKKLNIWVVPGGHYEIEDGSLEKTSLREASEETGINELSLHPWHTIHNIPLDIDTHPIPTNNKNGEEAHVHYDFRYVLTTPMSEEMPVDPRELLGLQWIDIEEIDPNSSIAPAIAKLYLINKT